jgi:hypothetical protein
MASRLLQIPERLPLLCQNLTCQPYEFAVLRVA